MCALENQDSFLDDEMKSIRIVNSDEAREEIIKLLEIADSFYLWIIH